ncbi:hypothetical protein ARSEF4850_006088 [Beauveria asiatica]
MPAFASCPPVVQVSEAKPFSEENIVQVVDDSFTFKPPGGSQLPLVIGEFKINIVDYNEWQTGKIATSLQISLSRELRGYAVKYNCPQVFCFDGYTLLMLQFKARKPEAIADEDCDIDCWLFRRRNPGGTTLRYALSLAKQLQAVPPTDLTENFFENDDLRAGRSSQVSMRDALNDLLWQNRRSNIDIMYPDYQP